MFSREKPYRSPFLITAPADLALTGALNAISSSFQELHQHYVQESAKGTVTPQDYLVGTVYRERIRAGNNKPPFEGEECLRSAVVSLARYSEKVWLRNLSFFQAHLDREDRTFPGFILLYSPLAHTWEALSGFAPKPLGEPEYTASTLPHKAWLKRRLREGVDEVRFVNRGVRKDEDGATIGSWWGVELPRLPDGNKKS